MNSASPIYQQFAALGVDPPAWPAWPRRHHRDEGWIQRGECYADAVQVWRDEIGLLMIRDKDLQGPLIDLLREKAELSAWDRLVCNVLIADVQALSIARYLQGWARIICTPALDLSQLWGAILTLARAGNLLIAVYGLRRIFQVPGITAGESLDVCNLFLEASNRMSLLAEEDCSPLALQFSLEFNLAFSALFKHCLEGSRPSDLCFLLSSIEKFMQDWPRFADEQKALKLIQARMQRSQRFATKKPLLRTIHHLASSGGTVISKCICALPNVIALSEVNPLNRHVASFEPNNPLVLFEQGGRTLTANEVKECFLQQINYIYSLCQKDDLDLLIRDHSQTDFCMGAAPSGKTPVRDFLQENYKLLSVITVRHPLDCYLGLLARGWDTQFVPSTLEEYSRRTLAFLDCYSHLPLRRYEDFCLHPQAFIRELCVLLEFDYSDEFITQFPYIKLTGDSGRRATTIALPERRPIPEGVAKEIMESESYSRLLARLNYEN
ncbi:MAG: hypothetical protein ACK575_09120 [Cyanobacteriota bacterium]